jgi:ribosomal protein S18 acetylase RimI-like enzyme
MIRKAETSDVQKAADIIVRAWQTAYDGIIDPAYPQTLKIENYVPIFTRNIEENLEHILVYEASSKVVGFISGQFLSGPHDCRTVGLYVDPDFQQRGIGSLLLSEMKKFFSDRGRTSMIVQTLEGARNNSFYRNHGGRLAERIDLEIGGRQYRGAVFVFCLHPSKSS